MKINHSQILLDCVAGRPSYHDIREELLTAVKQAGVKDGMLVAASAHTTCSLYFDETMHDKNYFGDEYLQVDINNIMEKTVPKMTSENQYNSPGPEHIAFGMGLSDPAYPAEKWTMLNTDAHIRSSLFGAASLTLIIQDGNLLLGPLGRVYFVDWDQLRERKRTVNVMVMGE